MSNESINRTFLGVIDAKTRGEILGTIASHYGISQADAAEELTMDGAAHLLDYLTGSVRTATSLLMKRHGMPMA